MAIGCTSRVSGIAGPIYFATIEPIRYLLAFCNEGFRDYRFLPIFVLKVFRHKSIFIHTDRGIHEPADLRGRKVATVGYSSSGLTWVLVILQDEYGISPEDIHWVQTTKDSATGQTRVFLVGKRSCPKAVPLGRSRLAAVGQTSAANLSRQLASAFTTEVANAICELQQVTSSDAPNDRIEKF